MGLFFGCFAVFLLVGVPIALALGLACTAYLWWTGDLDLLKAAPRYMVSGLDQFVLLAIPLFILAGNLMSSGGITDRIVRFSRALVGHVPGGLSLVGIVSCMLFSGVSGAATADAAAIGSVLIPAMDRDGYPKRYAAGLIAVATVNGPIIPPSIAMIIYGVLTGTSIAALFLAGFVPGLIVGLSLMGYAYWQAIRHGYPVSDRMSWLDRLRTTAEVAPAAMLPVIVLGGILSGVFTPTESAAVAVLFALALAGVFYRTLTLARLYTMLWETALVTAGVMIVVAIANVVAFVFAFHGLPQTAANALLSITDNKYVLLALINVALLVLGTFLEPLSIMILSLPVLLGIVKALGIDLVHFGLVVVLNVSIGMVTPPVGMCLFIASAISRLSIEEISRAALPMIAICIGVLMLVTYVPAVSLFLPALFGFGQ